MCKPLYCEVLLYKLAEEVEALESWYSWLDSDYISSLSVEEVCMMIVVVVKIQRGGHGERWTVTVIFQGRELKQESNVNSGNALCDFAELVCEIPIDKDGGTSLAVDIYAQADNRAKLSFAFEKHNQTSIGEVWTLAKKNYELAFSTYENAYSRYDAKFGDDLVGLLLNWSAGWISLTERTPDIVEVVKAFNYVEEKIINVVNFSMADINVYIALGELFSLQVEQVSQFPHQ
eukprot:Gb_36808 [translate_table: standard]